MITRPLVCLLGPPGAWKGQAASFVRAHNPNLEFDVITEPTDVDLRRALTGGAVAVWFTDGDLTSDLMVLVGWVLHAAPVRPVIMGSDPQGFTPSSVVELYRRATDKHPCRNLSILCHEAATAAVTHFNVARSNTTRRTRTAPPPPPDAQEPIACPSDDPPTGGLRDTDPTGSFEPI